MNILNEAGDITRLLDAAAQGEAKAADRLCELVYDELHKLAVRKMANESPGHTLQATELINEVWLRLFGPGGTDFKNRGHFFGAASEAMRRFLVEHARRKNAQKRNSGIKPEELNESLIVLDAPPAVILAVDEALDELEKRDTDAAKLVKLRFFVGLTEEELVNALGISRSTVQRKWSSAQAWLSVRLKAKEPS